MQAPDALAQHARYGRGLIVGKFAPLHLGHQLLIETALERCSAVTVMVYSNPDFPGMPQQMRAGWLTRLYPQLDVKMPLDPPLDTSGDQTHRTYARDYLRAQGVRVDAVFSSEDYGPGFAGVLGVPHVMVDRARCKVPVSGTQIRRDLGRFNGFLHPIVCESLNISRRG